MRQNKYNQFIREFACACLIMWAVMHAIGCVSISEQTAYQAITGGSHE